MYKKTLVDSLVHRLGTFADWETETLPQPRRHGVWKFRKGSKQEHCDDRTMRRNLSTWPTHRHCSPPTARPVSGNECLLVRGHHAVVWGTELFNDRAQLVGCRRTGFKFTILLFAFYLSHLLFIPSFLLLLSPCGLFLFHFVFFCWLIKYNCFVLLGFDF